MNAIQKKIKKAKFLLEENKVAQAFSIFNEVLSLDPNEPQALYYMGLAAQQQGNRIVALNYFQRSLAQNPRQHDVLFSTGILYQNTGDTGLAIEHYLLAYELSPENQKYAYTLANMLSFIQFTAPNAMVLSALTHLLSNPGIDTDRISAVWFSLYRFTEEYAALTTLGKEAPDAAKNISSTLLDKLLITGLRYSLVCNPDFEETLTIIRRNVLLTWQDEIVPEDFLCAMSFQNFYNEYAWTVTKEEQNALQLLVNRVAKQTANLREIFILACYQPLKSIPNIDHYARQISDRSESAKYIWAQQYLEPCIEEKLKNNIPALDLISDPVSYSVKEQYEENPYPRWKTFASIPPMSFKAHLKSKLPALLPTQLNSISDSNQVLVAGCGTGRQAIETASTFKGHRVTAVDLSFTSLAYAIRKHKELAPQAHIKFMQGDILQLGKHFKPDSFDIVECSGVLHHMNDPMAGWHVITSLLKKKGMMKISLYSQIARQGVIEIRKKIAQQNIPSTPDGIRSLRHEVKQQAENPAWQWLTVTPDFYSLSACRDLLFHVQEHQFTLPQIEKCLNDLGLEFLGFDTLNSLALENFQTFTGEKLPGTLVQWHRYEEANPQTFGGMYQFWVQKF